MEKATFGQYLELGQMIKSGTLDRDTVQALIEGRITITAMKPLGENEYLVPVGYDMPREKGKLESEFSKDGASELFCGNYEWQPHSSCAEIDQTPGKRVMLVKHFGRNTTSEANIAEMDKLGYRPATHLEANAFAKANPVLQRQFWIVALGSSTLRGGRRYVAELFCDSGGRILDLGWFGHEWDSDYRFLFVRK